MPLDSILLKKDGSRILGSQFTEEQLVRGGLCQAQLDDDSEDHCGKKKWVFLYFWFPRMTSIDDSPTRIFTSQARKPKKQNLSDCRPQLNTLMTKLVRFLN